MPSRFNYKFILLVCRQIREKYFSKRPDRIIVVLSIICIIVGSFLMIIGERDENASAQKNANEAQTLTLVPLSTDINSNFLTQVNECFIPTAAVYGYTLRISSGFRNVAEQDQLYNQGRTVNGHIVTEAPGGRSIHNFGFAVDVVDRWHEYDINWERLAKIGAYCGLEPSDEGDISHFEHRDGLTTDDFLAGKRPMPLAFPCAIMDERAKAGQPLTLNDLQNCGAPKF